MIIGILSRKGGVGKTTLAVHLAGLLAQEGPTVLVDEDDTRNATSWAERGGLDFAVTTPSGLLRYRDHQHFVTDSRGGMAPDDMQGLYDGSDRVLIPVNPEFMTMDTLVQTADILRAADPELSRLRVVMTMAKRGRRQDEAREALEALGLAPIAPYVRHSDAFKDASTEGLLVRDVRGNRLAKVCWQDIKDVLKAVRA